MGIASIFVIVTSHRILIKNNTEISKTTSLVGVGSAWYYMVMQDSVFTKIIKGEIPCYKIYEDDKNVAFLDIHPVMPGHVLVVPKNKQTIFMTYLQKM